MTKEETEPKEIKWLREYSNGRKELKENALKNGSLPDFAGFDLEFWKKIYEEGKHAGAELREKRIKELKSKVAELECVIEEDGKAIKELLPLIKENAKLKEQIEEMKLCQNCKFEDNDFLEKPCCDCIRCLGENIKRKGNADKWEIKENAELFLQNNEFAERFAEAIAILKDFLLMAKVEHLEDRYESVTDAEQFLRETDIDNAIQKANESLDLDKITDEVEQDIKEQKVK